MLSTDHSVFGLEKLEILFCAKEMIFNCTAELAGVFNYANSGRCHTGS